MNATEPQTQTETEGPIEARPICFIGGPMNGKTMADRGHNVVVLRDKETFRRDLYKRVLVTMNDAIGTMQRHVLAYFGETDNDGA